MPVTSAMGVATNPTSRLPSASWAKAAGTLVSRARARVQRIARLITGKDALRFPAFNCIAPCKGWTAG